MGFRLQLPADVLHICYDEPCQLSHVLWYVHDLRMKVPRFDSIGDDAEEILWKCKGYEASRK